MSLPTIETTCHRCGGTYTKLRCEYRRSLKKGTPQFCSPKCSTEYRNEKIGTAGWRKIHNYLIKEDSVFIIFVKLAWNKCQQRKKEFNLDVGYLRELWEKQRGICPYTGIKMILPDCGKSWNRCHSLEKLSLDRIDSSKGYIKGNVEFVCLGINYAKNNRSKEDMKLFIERIRANGTTSIQQDSK